MVMRGLHKRQQESARNARVIKIMVIGICVCLAFVGGFLIRGEHNLLNNLGLGFLNTSGEETTQQTGSLVPKDGELSLRVAEIEALLQSESLYEYDVDEATDLVLAAYTDVTKDEYLRYYDQARYAVYVFESSGKQNGVGVLFSEYKGSAYAVDVFPESAAAVAGVRQGDFVVAINDDRTQKWTLTEAVNALSNDEGETVKVTWRRPTSLEAAGGDEFVTSLVFSKITEQNVSHELVDNVGYITLKQLTQNSADLVKEAITTLTSQGAKSFVLDIRDNPGGYLTQAVDVASLFVRSGIIVVIETKSDHDSTKTATGSVVTDKPLVVLVNGNTAAAAEVIAASLKDSGRATVVGSTTIGKGSVQVVRPLSFGGALRYTAAFYKSPNGQSINGMGVTPNLAVANSASSTVDSQKNQAIETAQSLVSE